MGTKIAMAVLTLVALALLIRNGPAIAALGRSFAEGVNTLRG